MTATKTTHAAPLPLQPRALDACGVLASLNQSQLTVAAVQNCYEAIPFNRDVASSIYQTVYTMFNELYIFRDSALTPNLPKPFASDPVDVIGELQRIGKATYKGDYFFNEDIRSTLATLHDAHVSYSLDCYSSYVFAQALNLYAPVINGVQWISVYKDHFNRGYEGCQVMTIDGKGAVDYMYDWATKHLSYSKDGGVRLNQALATQIYDLASNAFVLSSGEFAERSTVPESGAVEYVLRCPAAGSTDPTQQSTWTETTIRDVWRVFPTAKGTFTDTASFVSNMCLQQQSTDPNNNNNAPSNAGSDYRPLHHPHYHPTPKKSQMEQYVQSNPMISKAHPPPRGGGDEGDVDVSDDGQTTLPNAPTPQVFEDAEKLGAGNATVFYRLKSKPNVGVIVVWTHEAEAAELDTVLNYMDIFHQKGVTNILFDFQGNGGGSVDFASFLVQLFFPNKDPLDKSLSSDLRVSLDIQTLSKSTFNNSEGGLFNAGQYVNLQGMNTQTVQLYTDDDLFQSPVGVVRNGRVATYTKRTTLEPTTIPPLPQLATYPWTNNPANIRVLSDGRCGSACTLSAYQLHANYKVETYAIGGHQGLDLSLFSFAGGAVGGLSDIEKMFKALDETSVSSGQFLTPLPYRGDVRMPILEVFATSSSTVPLEYDAQFYAANHHFDFDAANARDRGVMWTQVATSAWSS
ncbi:hypothetical protein BGZ83_008228 [Gryganskiella cystojenkinii]|nr:hypothetical protein BGZ83_008228 [Gryganskiella cystojenkinii]